MPPGASLPAAMTAAHPRAVGSYGMRAVEWVRREMGVELRWFQRLTMVRQLEHDADGRLTWTYVVQSTPRRVGKSIYLKCLSCWRVDHAGLLGEPQTVLFTGKDLPICKEIHRGAWVWAKGRGWRVARGMGNEEIEKPDGSRWLVRSQNGVYGYPAGMGACDEAWAVPDAVIREGLQPALMDRSSPQLLLTSTAHTKATVLMRRRIRDALDVLDGSGDVLLLLWAAPRDADPSDPAGWRAASPHWDVFRERLIGDAWNQTVSGLAVPDPLEPDPVEGFRAQYLNVWPDLGGAATAAGLVDGRVWDSLLSAGGVPVAVGVESEQGGMPVVAVVSRGADGALVVGVRQAGSMVEAADWCRQVGCRPQVGKSLLHDPVWRDLGAVGMSGTAGELCGAFQQLVADRVIGHDGGDVLSGQVRGAAVRPLAGGRIGVSGRVDAVKAAVWAVGAARSAPPRPRIW